MKKNTLVLSLALGRRLIEAGCPLDPEVERQIGEAHHGVEICQSGNVFASWIFDLECGGMGLVLSSEIANTAAYNLRLQQIRVQLPWVDPSFYWLEDPHRKSPREEFYEFPKPPRVDFERDIVLNHQIGSRGPLLPGESIDGLLLGVGQMPIPEQYLNRHSMRLRLQVFDTGGNERSGEFQVLVDREWKTARARRPHLPNAVGTLRAEH